MIITIGRQYGSGGREIGEKLAERLHYSYYDTLILEKAAQESGISREIIERYDEQLKDKWITDLALGSGANNTDNLPLSLRAALSQFEAIRKIGQKGSAVIVGRCADYVLRAQDDVLSVFVHADKADRAARVAMRNQISIEEARKRIKNTDKHRAAYYTATQKRHGAVLTATTSASTAGALGSTAPSTFWRGAFCCSGGHSGTAPERPTT